MEKTTALFATLTLALPAFGEPAADSAPTPTPASPDQVQAEAAEIMAAAEVRASAPLAPAAAPSVEDEAYLAGFRARLERHDGHILALPQWTLTVEPLGDIDRDRVESLSMLSTSQSEEWSFNREGLGWLVGGSNTRLTLHAAYIRGAAGDPNSRTPLPTVADSFDQSPSAARRQFVLTLQAQFVF